MAQWIKALLGILFIVLAVLFFYSFAGTSEADTFTAYHIDATDPSASWMEVTITLRPSSRPFVDLYLLDRRQIGKNRVRKVTAARGDQPLATWEPFSWRSDIQRVWTGFSTEPVTVHYQVHGQWRKNRDQFLSYLGPEYGYLYSEAILYTPVTINEIFNPRPSAAGDELGRSTVVFDLPPGWQVVSPLDIEHLEVQTAVLREVYFTVGPIEVEQIQSGSDSLIIGSWDGLPSDERQLLQQAAPRLYESMRVTAGYPNNANTCFRAITILPDEPIEGHAIGEGSLVVEARLEELSGALFRWWTGNTYQAAPDAGWLDEGFTTYYQARLLQKSGLWTQAQFDTAIHGYQQQLWPDGTPVPLHLVQTSQHLARTGDAADWSELQYGGALLAYQLDLALQAQGSSLDPLWAALKDHSGPVTTQAFLDIIQTLAGSELRSTAQAVLFGQAAPTIQTDAK